MWQCPGGKCEPMEGTLEAIARETKEETALDLPLVRFDFYGILHIKGEGYSAAVWSVQLKDDEVPLNTEPEKQSDWQLFSIAEMYKLGLAKELVPTLSKMLDVTIL